MWYNSSDSYERTVANMAKKENFMKGAFILIAANILVKVIGAGFKIPLTYLLNENGMALFTTSYTLYAWLFIIATAGMPVAISRMISEARAKQNYGEVKKIFRVSLALLSAIGIIGACILYFGAGIFAETIATQNAKYSIMAIAPAMLFVSLMSAYRGFFQGHQDMYPTAVSEVSEAVAKLAIGYFAAYQLLDYGVKYAAAGAVFGVSMSGLIGFLVLFVIYNIRKKDLYSGTSRGFVRTDKSILRELVAIAVPITIGASVFSLTSLIDMSMIMRNLRHIGFSEKQAEFLWGSYSGYAIPLFNLPPTIVTSISISIVPAISGAFALGDKPAARSVTGNSLLVTIIFALPCAVGMSLLAKPILEFVYHNTNAASTLSILGIAVLFVSLVLVTNAVLQSVGKERIPVRNMIIGGVVKVIANFVLVRHPDININGAPIGTNLCYAIILVLNLYYIRRELSMRFSAVQYIVKPLICAAVMGAAAVAIYSLTGSAGNSAALIAAIAGAAAVYAVMLVATKTINRELLALIPGGEKLIPILKGIIK